MSFNVTIKRTADGKQNVISIDQHPDACPRCHRAVDPEFVTGVERRDRLLELVYRCRAHECESYFIAYYQPPFRSGPHVLRSCAPHTPAPRTFPPIIKDISGDFVEIYNQAARAEELDLSEVAGVGYRKALEFLIKDYLIARNEDDADDIRGEFLGASIKNRIEDQRLLTVAERAAWLGNDETHYERRWVDQDMNDLKQLIDLTVHWIMMEALTEHYGEEMTS